MSDQGWTIMAEITITVIWNDSEIQIIKDDYSQIWKHICVLNLKNTMALSLELKL